MSGSSDLGSDEEASASNTPTHDRLTIKRAAVADETGKLAATTAAYGSTATASAATGAAVVVAAENGEPASQESSKLLVGGAAGDDEDGVDDEDDVDEDDEYDSGVDIPGQGRKKGRGGLGAITPPLGFCLFGYFVNKLITEVCAYVYGIMTSKLFGRVAVR